MGRIGLPRRSAVRGGRGSLRGLRCQLQRAMRRRTVDADDAELDDRSHAVVLERILRSLALVIHSGSIRAASDSPHARARAASPSSLAQGPRIEVVPRLRARNSSAICAHGEEVRQMPDDPDRSDEPRGSERAVLTLEQRQREAAPAHLLAKRAQAGDQGDGNDADRRQAAVAAEVAHAGRVAGYRRDAKSNTEEGNGAQRRHPPAPGILQRMDRPQRSSTPARP